MNYVDKTLKKGVGGEALVRNPFYFTGGDPWLDCEVC